MTGVNGYLLFWLVLIAAVVCMFAVSWWFAPAIVVGPMVVHALFPFDFGRAR